MLDCAECHIVIWQTWHIPAFLSLECILVNRRK
jgi:hypothetical protein